MKKEKIIEEIISEAQNQASEEFLAWTGETEENRQEYIRYKNLWALLQQGHEMDEQQVRKDLARTKARLNKRQRTAQLTAFARYAAIVVVALCAGFLLSTLLHNPDSYTAENEISVPRGNRSLVALPDGSQVWLTNGSKITYPQKWNENHREVTLTGEAYFTVAHHGQSPFFVNIDTHRVKVVGTEFSVVSYPDDSFIQVDLVSGKVHMEIATPGNENHYASYELEPMHSLTYDRASGELNYSEITKGFFNYWQNGIYAFNDERFDELAKKIERIYGISLVFEDSTVQKRTFTGTFGINDNIYTMMEVFKHASGSPFNYRIENKKIYIKSVK